MFQKLPLNKLIPAEWNYKAENDAIQLKLENNIKKNGFIENLIVRELDNGKYEVVNGNHRLKALQTLKFKDALCYNLGKVSDSRAARIAIETNETRFGTDKAKLAAIIKTLNDEFGTEELANTLPYEIEALADIDAHINDTFEWKSEDDGQTKDMGQRDRENKREPEIEETKEVDLSKIELSLEADVKDEFLNTLFAYADSIGLELDPANLDQSDLIDSLTDFIKLTIKKAKANG